MPNDAATVAVPLTAEDIRRRVFAAPDRQFESVPIPEWGVTIVMRSLSAAEKDVWEDSILKMKTVGKGKKKKSVRRVDAKNLRAKLVAACAVVSADDVTPVFTEADLDALGAKNAVPVDRLFEAAQRLTGITEEDEEDLGNG